MRPAWAGSTSTRSSTARGSMDLSQLRALQDWFLKYELKAVPNVAEVASVGGMVRQYQIVLDPDRLRAYNIPHGKVIDAVQKANQETGGSVLELGEAEYMVRASGYLQSLDDFRKIPLDDDRRRRSGAPGRRRARAGRSRDAPRHRRARRRGRSGRRHHRHALGQERAGDDRRRQGEARDAQAEPAAGRGDRPDLRPLEPDQARGRRISQEKLIEEFIVVALVCVAVPVPPALGVRGDRVAAARAC